MLMDCIEAISFILDRKEDSYVFQGAYKIWIDYGFYKGNTKFIEPNNFYCVE